MTHSQPEPRPDAKEELARLHLRLSELADEQAPAQELWSTLERIRELRAQLDARQGRR
jgi:hypothetical protein